MENRSTICESLFALSIDKLMQSQKQINETTVDGMNSYLKFIVNLESCKKNVEQPDEIGEVPSYEQKDLQLKTHTDD